MRLRLIIMTTETVIVMEYHNYIGQRLIFIFFDSVHTTHYTINIDE